jgi:hypothetical protein
MTAAKTEFFNRIFANAAEIALAKAQGFRAYVANSTHSRAAIIVGFRSQFIYLLHDDADLNIQSGRDAIVTNR